MMVSDAQKHFTLKVQRGLITDGMFKFIRHPNYLGEMLIYGSFATMAPVKYFPISWGVLAFVWLQLFLPNMLGKEASMSRYPQVLFSLSFFQNKMTKMTETIFSSVERVRESFRNATSSSFFLLFLNGYFK